VLKKILAISLLLSTSIVATSTAGRAENPGHLNQLLSTKACADCNLVNAGLVLGELSGADLKRANLVGANLSQARLTGADLRGANLTGASLNGADLTGADLTGAILNSTDLRDSFLGGANLTGVNLQNAYLQGAVGLAGNAGIKDLLITLAKQFVSIRLWPVPIMVEQWRVIASKMMLGQCQMP
jgi:hypothetical protein